MTTKPALILLIFLVACNGSQQNDALSVTKSAKYQVDLKDALERPMHELLKLQDVIILDSIPEPGFFKSIDKFFKMPEGFILFDKALSNVFIFDDSGNFMREIGKRGEGPQEYKSIYDIVYDEQKSQIHLLSNADQKIFIYATDGTFISQVNLNFYNNSFCYQDENYYIEKGYDAEDRFNLIKMDSNNNILNSYFPYPEEKPIMSFAFSGGINNTGIINTYTEATSSLIFEIDSESDQITPLYSIMIDENTWVYNDRHYFEKFNNELRNFKVSYLTNSFVCSSNELVFEYQQINFLKRAYFKNRGELFKIEGNFERIFSMPIGLASDSLFVATCDPEVYSYLKGKYPDHLNEIKDLSPKLFEKLEKLNKTKDDSLFLVTYSIF